MIPDNLAIGSAIQIYLDLGYDWEVAVNKAARADRLSRHRRSPQRNLKESNLKESIERIEIAADCYRWTVQCYDSNS